MSLRVIDWMCRRAAGEDIAIPSPVGLIPKKGSINLEGLSNIDWDELVSLPKDYWKGDVEETGKFFEEQVGEDLPAAIREEHQKQKERIAAM